jgi:hypothetical protein
MTDNFIVVEKGIMVGCLWFAPLRMKLERKGERLPMANYEPPCIDLIY